MGDVQSEEHTKDSGIFNQPIPRSDSSSVILLDLFGCSKKISVEGIITGTTTVQNTFITAIESINNGQQSSSTFTSSIRTSTYNVFIETFTWTKNAADPSKLNYSLTLLEGAEVEAP